MSGKPPERPAVELARREKLLELRRRGIEPFIEAYLKRFGRTAR